MKNIHISLTSLTILKISLTSLTLWEPCDDRNTGENSSTGDNDTNGPAKQMSAGNSAARGAAAQSGSRILVQQPVNDAAGLRRDGGREAHLKSRPVSTQSFLPSDRLVHRCFVYTLLVLLSLPADPLARQLLPCLRCRIRKAGAERAGESPRASSSECRGCFQSCSTEER